MSEKLSVKQLHDVANVVEAPVRTKIERTFGLPVGLYVATVALYFGFLAVMGSAFMNASLAIPMAIFVFLIAAGFGVPTIWVKMKPDHNAKSMTWGQLASKGIQTHTGLTTAGQAAVQVLILPTLIFVWGVIVAVIAAFV